MMVRIFAVTHRRGVSLVRATTPENAIKKAERLLGSLDGPYYVPLDHERLVDRALAMQAKVL